MCEKPGVFRMLAHADNSLELGASVDRDGRAGVAAIDSADVAKRRLARVAEEGAAAKLGALQHSIVEIKHTFLRIRLPQALVLLVGAPLRSELRRRAFGHVQASHGEEQLRGTPVADFQCHGLERDAQGAAEQGIVLVVHVCSKCAVLPAIELHHNADGLAQVRQVLLALPHLHHLVQVGAELHRVRIGTGLLERELLADAPDNRLGGLAAGVAQVLEGSQLPGLEKEACRTQGPLALINVPGKHHCMHEVSVRVVRKLRRQELLETCPQVPENAAVGIAVVHDSHQFDSAALNDLIQDVLPVEESRLSLLVGVEAADVVHGAHLEGGEQVVQVAQVCTADGTQALPSVGGRRPACVGHACDKLLAAVCK
mmetsp:Transcript_80960/g.112444  ORF Transcript_80960/g.112444 Transcript_80960/m.112444 type:complete len:370 (+) Transcript_80960:1155-2264(+)